MRDKRHRVFGRLRGVVTAALGAAVVSSALVLAQTPTQQLVLTDVRVRDQNGVFLSDLRREDFRVLEDGIEQDIVALVLDADETSAYYVVAFYTGNPDPRVGTRRMRIEMVGREGDDIDVQFRVTCRAEGEVVSAEQFRVFRSRCGTG
ncbi:MAG: hypothetical protein QF786_12475 [Vicinamibacterales bacterium]|nr:hypothetical protein [Vicinamibacterales bacterium]HJN43525.1 hypothetical protein [Vicinamibacterales bacterium]|tara:strand:+ start:4943 stop:5386 length:444 start_codon:yes stop_codon:yes gene_type:complete